MIREHDLVVLKRDRKEAGLEKGDVGTVVFVYPGADTWWSLWITKGTPWPCWISRRER